ncbi:hypothetical protein CH267_28225 [Rhodococcus sp. 06-621-2]|nr:MULTISPECIES: hypothetical protein [unclassified Rhodococcus (in: high G+C Gram-positive bacteria)]OZC46339.1 hypothetical protein CH267_28225 [Rhodococcus sp. 06-621-2]OZD64683.1 hypothetical protein CH263_14085 [Rhodococcus sp. 06-1059B-a]
MTVLTSKLLSLETYLRERLQDARNDVESLEDKQFDDVDSVIEEIVEQYGVERLVVDRVGISLIATKPLKVGLQGERGGVSPSQELIATFRVPYTGPRDVWSLQPRGDLMTGSTDPLSAFTIGDSEHLVLSLRVTGLQQNEVRNAREQNLGWLETKVGWANGQIDEFDERLRSSVRESAEHRMQLIAQGRALEEASDVPLYKAPAEEQVPIPLERKRVRLDPSKETTANEQVMAEHIYADVVQTIEQMTRAMERTPTAGKLHEEEIRNLILFVLNANYRGAAAGEVFNGEGKTDILLRWNDANVFIGECKFWTGPAAFRDAINQLHGYVTWRDTKAALIVFVRGGDATQIMEKARKELRNHATFDKELPASSDTRSDFVLRSTSDADRLISVALVGVVVPEKSETSG